MNSSNDIMRAVKAYIEIPDTTYAIMVDGDWGCGKTYLWKNTILPIVGNDEALYISLFGLNSIEDIENEIFKSMSLLGENTGGFFKGLLNKSTIDISDDIKLGGIGFAVQYGMKKLKESKLNKIKKLFICFDDFERWAGDVSVCLSYVNKLVEHDGTKCLIIGNTTKIFEQNKYVFNYTKDKTIGFKYRLKHSPSDAFYAAIKLANLSNDKFEKFIINLYKHNSKRIDYFLINSKCLNIRIISTAINYLCKIVVNNYDKFKLSEPTSVEYFISLISTLIIVEMYRTSDNDKEIILDYNIDNSYDLLKKIGRNSFDDNAKDKLTEDDKISEYLVYQSFSGVGEIKRKGICSIITNGFYRGEDFVDEFEKWKFVEDYEIYLDTFKIWYMDDEKAQKLFESTYKTIFTDKRITNPLTLLFISARMTSEIKRGVLPLDFETLKSDFRRLFNELYDNEKIEKSVKLDYIWRKNGFEYCEDLCQEIMDLNSKYNEHKNEFELSQFWVKLSNDPLSMDELLEKYKCLEIFEQYKNTDDILKSIDTLSNSQLFELTRWMGSRVQQNPNINSVNPRYLAVAVAIDEKYSDKFGVRAGHFKQIARILKNLKTDYDPEYIQATP